MFDPKTLKPGDVVEFMVRDRSETLRGQIIELRTANHEQFVRAADGEQFAYIQALDMMGLPLEVGKAMVELDRILGLVDDGALPIKARAGWDEYFMSIADVAASRATCDRKHVGSVIVNDKTILSTGYNGSIRGVESCRERGHMMEDGHCVRTVHAEANAIVQAAKNGVRIDGAELYTTASPCWWCFKLIANAGIKRVVFGEMYRDQRIFAMASRSGIEVKIL